MKYKNQSNDITGYTGISSIDVSIMKFISYLPVNKEKESLDFGEIRPHFVLFFGLSLDRKCRFIHIENNTVFE